MTTCQPLVDHVRSAQLPPVAERRRIRRRAGVSLRSVADALGVSPQSVLRWERGERPTLEHAAAYRELLEALRAALDAA
jgi:transcriptional regulator with XRE-family HTH domain